MAESRFKVGQRVEKTSGYRYPGVFVAAFKTCAGHVRYVVEADVPGFEGMLHIFSEAQLGLRQGESK